MSFEFSERYPPRNRRNKSLGLLAIEIEDLAGIKRYDPNSVAVAFLEGEARKVRPIARPNFAGVSSELSSGYAAVLYRSDDVELRLRPDELERLVMLRLTPEEFKKLRNRYGVFFEIHSDFYDEDTGSALQPREAA